MDRRSFNKSLAAVAAASLAKRATAALPAKGRTVIYNSVGDTLTHWDVDVENAALIKRKSITLPSVVQYGWPHPTNRYLYVCSTDSERGSKTITGEKHFLYALRPDINGNLLVHGKPAGLRQRPIHNSVDHTGKFALLAYNAPGHVSVHNINDDGTVGTEIPQPADLDVGFFSHQIQTTPSNRSAYLSTRGNNPSPEKPMGDPGALKLFHFNEGHLTPMQDVRVHGHNGYGYGPRHLDFHPSKPWVYVLIELQNQLHMHHMVGEGLEPEPAYIKSATQFPVVPGVVQVAGAIHVHPRGHVLYASNRVSATTHPIGAFPFDKGEDNIAVFAINQETGEPTAIQYADPHGFHIRAMTIDPSGTLLIAASLAAMTKTVNGKTETIPAGLSVFRIGEDGKLTFANKYDVELAPGVQQMWVRSMLLNA